MIYYNGFRQKENTKSNVQKYKIMSNEKKDIYRQQLIDKHTMLEDKKAKYQEIGADLDEQIKMLLLRKKTNQERLHKTLDQMRQNEEEQSLIDEIDAQMEA